jgi:hypothetical protein
MYIHRHIADYFKSIAVNHPDIRHEDKPGKVGYAVDNYADLLDGVFRNALKPSGYSLRLIDSSIKPEGDESQGLLAHVDTGFTITKRIPELTDAEVQKAKDECLKITQEVIARMVMDSRDRLSLFQSSLNRISYGQFLCETSLFKGDGFWIGIVTTFQFKVEFIEDICDLVNQTGWLDK